MTWLPSYHPQIHDDRQPSWAGGRPPKGEGGQTSATGLLSGGLPGLPEKRDMKDTRRDDRGTAEEGELVATGVPNEVIRSIRDGDWRVIKAYVLAQSKELNSMVGALVELQLPDRPLKLLATRASSAADLGAALRIAVRLDRVLRAHNTRRPDVAAALREIVILARTRAAKEGDCRIGAVKRLLRPVKQCLATMRKY